MQKSKLVLQVLAASVGMMLSADFVAAAEQARAEVKAQAEVKTQAQVQTQGQVQVEGQTRAQGAGPDGAEKTQTQAQTGERVYGSQLMTHQERAEYYTKLRKMRTPEEREAFRLEHHKKMQERAKAQGKTLYDLPPAQGANMGPGGGMSGAGGMGPGGGMGGAGGMGPGGGMGRGR